MGERGEDGVATHQTAQENPVGAECEAGLGGDAALKPDLVAHSSSYLDWEMLKRRKTIQATFSPLSAATLSATVTAANLLGSVTANLTL